MVERLVANEKVEGSSPFARSISYLIMLKKILKKLILFQHKHLPIPLLIYKYLFRVKTIHAISEKYGVFCYNHEMMSSGNLKGYKEFWKSKRALYWYYIWDKFNRYDKFFADACKKYPKVFDNKNFCDPMAGIGSQYSINNYKQKMILMDINNHCCKILKKKFPESIVINESWKYLEKIPEKINTIILFSGCLVYLDKEEIELFFKITKNVENFLIFVDGAENDTFYSKLGTTHYDLKKRLEKHNNHFKNSEIFIEKKKNSTNYIKFFIINKKYL